MPIVINLDVVLAKRKYTLTELSQKIGITVANLSVLKAGRGRAIRFSTLDAICNALQCQPGEILEHVDHETYKKLYGREWIFEEEE